MKEQATEQAAATTGPSSMTAKVDKLIHDPFGSVIAAVVMITASSGLVYVGINALGSIA